MYVDRGPGRRIGGLRVQQMLKGENGQVSWEGRKGWDTLKGSSDRCGTRGYERGREGVGFEMGDGIRIDQKACVDGHFLNR